MKSLEQLVRPNIWRLQPYSSARGEFHGDASVFLDANENPFNSEYNRYPDPLQWKLKEKIAALKGVDVKNIFLGNGSDEPIDLFIRTFCEPRIDNVVSITPSYGMYQVAAETNDVAFRTVKLNEQFDITAASLLAAVDKYTKLIYLCSPNNPTGNLLNREELKKVLNLFEGIVIIDEAYVDFSSEPSFLSELKNYPNLVVFQTFSKAWGAAGIRLGMAFASPEIIAVLNKVKYPYNVNILTQRSAIELLSHEDRMHQQKAEILSQRAMLEKELPTFECVRKVYPSDSNFLLMDVGDANGMYDYLVEKGVIVRNRNNITLCEGCLRITVGTPEENATLLNALKERNAK